jgi:hypothetical protein
VELLLDVVDVAWVVEEVVWEEVVELDVSFLN